MQTPNFVCIKEMTMHLLFIILLFPCQTSTLESLSPVILVPGYGGSQMEGKWEKERVTKCICPKSEENWTPLWLKISDLSPLLIDCFIDNMRLVYDSTSQMTSNSPGVEIRIPDLNGTSSIEYLDEFLLTHPFTGYFDVIVGHLRNIGYQRKVNLFGAPYDFRKAPNELAEYYIFLTDLIEAAFKKNNLKVTLIAHSMGAPVLHYFLIQQNQAWKDTYIQSLISLSGAWGGSVKTMTIYAAGYNWYSWYIAPAKMKKLMSTFPSLAFLMPSDEVWIEDNYLVKTLAKEYKISNIHEYFTDLGMTDVIQMYTNTKDILKRKTPPNVEIHCLYGDTVATANRMRYETTNDFPDHPTIDYGDGDGTVNLKSEKLCLEWRDQQEQQIIEKAFHKVDHTAILSNQDVMMYITSHLLSVQTKNTQRSSPITKT